MVIAAVLTVLFFIDIIIPIPYTGVHTAAYAVGIGGTGFFYKQKNHPF